MLLRRRFWAPSRRHGLVCFCGAFTTTTTFSSVVLATDQLVTHGHRRTAVIYLLATIAAGLASSFGLVVGRAVAANRHRAHTEWSPQ